MGRLLVAELPLEVAVSSEVSVGDAPSAGDGASSAGMRSDRTSPEDPSGDLERCSRLDEATSTEFEQSVARAFERLGFHAEHIDGPGKTDVPT